MIDNATLAEWENDLERMSAVYAPRMRDAIAEIRRLWEELESLPTWGTYRGQSAIKTVRLKLKENTAQIVSLIHERDEALAKIRRLRESQGDCALRAHDMHARCHCEPLDAALAAHRAVIREADKLLSSVRASFVKDASPLGQAATMIVDAWRALPLVQQAREEKS